MRKKTASKVCKIALLSLLMGGSVSHAEMSPGDIKYDNPKGRVPASFTEGYKKIKEGAFEAQGFGEDFPEPDKLREPASKKEKSKNDDQSSVDESDVTTVKNKIELDNELQLQRRVDVFYEGRVRLKNGAAIWATEDAGAVSPKLEISAQEQVDPLAESIRFRVYTNYLPFIKNWELRIFKKSQAKTDEEVAVLKGEPEDIYNMEYKFEKDEYSEGDTLFYQLKVFQSEKIFDVIQTKKITFVNRVENQNLDESDDQSESDLVEKIWGGNSIEKQNIPIRGSRVRIVGNNIPQDHFINYRGQSIRVDEFGKFVVEEHFPIGKHQINVDIKDATKKEDFRVPFNLDISGKYLFFVGIADFRVGENKLSEKLTGLGANDFEDKMFVDGRLAFFLKGKIKGKYLITAQMDTTEGPVENMFDGLHRKNSESLFRRLDKDRYYPVYGDNSSTREGAPTLGKLYVKVEVDNSYLMWGNDHSGFSRTLLSQYNRTLYGAHLKYESKVSTKFGDRKSKLKAFAAEPETLLGHNEFVGSGGRQFTLRHNDVVEGSEKLVIEVRDRLNPTIMKKQIALKPFEDYEFNQLSGRILLNQALTTFVQNSGEDITSSNGLSNNLYYLVVDYEYNASGSDLSDSTVGVSGEQWFGDHVSVGATYVREKKGGVEYTLEGVDASVKLGRQSFIKAEKSRTQNQQSQSTFVSEDTGNTFIQKPFTTTPTNTKAGAWAVESQVYLNDFMDTKNEAVLSSYFRNYEAGFSTVRRQSQRDLSEYGHDFEFKFYERNVLKVSTAKSDEDGGRKNETFITSLGRRFGRGSTLSAEYRVEEDSNVNSALNNGKGELAGFKINQKINSGWSVYGKAQQTLEQEGAYTNNDRWALGTKFRINRKWEGSGEYSDGDRGDAVNAGVGYNIDQSYKVYGNLDKSIDSSSGRVSNGITLGQKKRFKNGFSLTSENQFQDVADEAGINQLYGLDYNINRVLTAGISYQAGDLENQLTGVITSKEAVSASLTYTKDTDLTATTKLSFIENRGAQNFDQILSTNSLRFKIGPSHTMSFEADFSKTEDPNLSTPLAEYIEGNVGYAYRPVRNDRFNYLLKYTYLYDLDSQAQANARNDQKVSIFSTEGSYELNRKWELGGRVAQKIGSERLVRGTGAFVDTTLTFAQMRLRYHLLKKWDGLFELRAVKVKEANEIQSGLLLGLDYHLGGNLKIGAGYNFTRFNNDLTNFSFDNRGWFINIIGKM